MKKLIFIIKFCKKDFLLYFVGDILNNLAPLIIGFVFKIIIDYYDIINIIQIVMLLIVRTMAILLDNGIMVELYH